MNFDHSEKTKQLIERLEHFMASHIYPNRPVYDQQMRDFGTKRWQIPAIIEELKTKAKAEGLWNLFAPDSTLGAGLNNVEYAPLAEIMGRVDWASEIFNCSAPDTGNMEVLMKYGTDTQKEKWLTPLLNGDIRSAFLMTEPDVASSDATNIKTSIIRDGDDYVINGVKWWSSGAGDPRCQLAIVMGKTLFDETSYKQQSMILMPMACDGITIKRHLNVFGYDDAPHGHMEIALDNVRVKAENLLLGEGRGFEIAQGRLGPGRIHHCMRTIGAAEVALEQMCQRLLTRTAFGKKISDHSVWEERLARARTDIEMTRLLCLKAAYLMDTLDNKAARAEIAMIKVAGPTVALNIIDDAIQAHGGGGVSQDYGLAQTYARIRTLRLADGPDEVHNRTIARLELKKYLDDAQSR